MHAKYSSGQRREGIALVTSITDNQSMTISRLLSGLFCIFLLVVPAALAQPDLPATTKGMLQSRVRSIALSPDGKRLAVGIAVYQDNILSPQRFEIWDVATLTRLHSLPTNTNQYGYVTFSPDGTKLLTRGYLIRDSKTLISAAVWEVATGRQICRLALESPEDAWKLTFSSDGNRVLGCGRQIGQPQAGNTVKFWNSTTGEVEHTFPAPAALIANAQYAGSGEAVILSTTKDLETQQSSIHLLDAVTGKTIRTIPVNDKSLQSTSPAPDGRSVALHRVTTQGIEALESHVELHSLSGNRPALTLSLPDLALERRIVLVQFSPDSKEVLAVALTSIEGSPAELWRWDAQTGENRPSVNLGEVPGIDFAACSFSSDGKTLVMAIGKTVQLRRTSDGTVIHQFTLL